MGDRLMLEVIQETNMMNMPISKLSNLHHDNSRKEEEGRKVRKHLFFWEN